MTRTDGICCIYHGPECDEPDHMLGTTGMYYSGKGLCGRCGERKGTVPWGDPNRAHTLRCEICATEEQLEHARERASAIPELEAKLARLKGAMPVSLAYGEGTAAD
jgi:hypothetical protein